LAIGILLVLSREEDRPKVHFVLGIDGGGTSCRAALATLDGHILSRAKSGAANIRTDLTGARDSICEAAKLAFAEAGKDPGLIAETPALLGLAGSNVGTYRRQLEAILPFRKSIVEADYRIALEGALGEADGAIAILGTGSAFLVRQDGVMRAVGGWGFLIGDQGGGARIGRDLLEETLLAHDGIRDASALTRALMAVFRDDPRDVVEFTTTAKPGDFGGFAPMVFDFAEKGDAVAQFILKRAVDAVEASLDVLDLRSGDPLCLLGGLASLIEARLSGKFRRLVRPPMQDALGGAVMMAVRAFGGEVKAHG
jgi:glucosamine kinase